MFVGHLAAGYLVSRAGRYKKRDWRQGICIGSVLPDADMIWFIFVDHGSVHHHSYPSHAPLAWLAIAILARLVTKRSVLLQGIGVGGSLHCLLDGITGAVRPGWPFSDRVMTLVEVPATQQWWVMSFLLHWSFAIELTVCFIAIFVWLFHD